MRRTPSCRAPGHSARSTNACDASTRLTHSLRGFPEFVQLSPTIDPRVHRSSRTTGSELKRRPNAGNGIAAVSGGQETKPTHREISVKDTVEKTSESHDSEMVTAAPAPALVMVQPAPIIDAPVPMTEHASSNSASSETLPNGSSTSEKSSSSKSTTY
jgi:hypothetical protein